MVINLFGDAIYYNVIELTNSQMKMIMSISINSKTEPEELLFDLSVLEILGFDSINQMHSIASGGGIRFEKETKFEWRNQRKTLRKISLIELNNDDLLFPMYSITDITKDLDEYIEESKNRFILVEIVRGHLGKYTLKEDPQLEDLTFEFTTLKNQKGTERLFTNVYFQGQKIPNKKSDGVILKQFARKL